jgi:hypothetical protein
MTGPQHHASLKPLPKGEHLKFEHISQVPDSKWYCYTLICGDKVYTRVRIRVPRDYSYMEHYIRCSVTPHSPSEWQAVVKMEAVSDEHVSNVHSGSAFVLPNRVLRVDGHYAIRFAEAGSDLREHEVIRAHNSGNPFPYSSRDRDY